MERKKLFIFYYLKIVGLCPFSIGKEDNVKFSYSGLFINLSYACVYLFFALKVYVNRFSLVLPQETIIAVIVYLIAHSFQALTILNCLLTIGFRQKILIKFFEELKRIDIQIATIRRKKSKKRNFISSIIIVGVAITVIDTVYFIICSVEHLRFLGNDSFSKLEVVFWVIFQNTYVVLFNSIIVFLETMIIIRDYLLELNLSLRQYSKDHAKLKGICLFTNIKVVLFISQKREKFLKHIYKYSSNSQK